MVAKSHVVAPQAQAVAEVIEADAGMVEGVREIELVGLNLVDSRRARGHAARAGATAWEASPMPSERTSNG